MVEEESRLEARDLNQQGALLLKTGNIEAAKAKFERAIDLDPMLADSYRNYGDLYMHTEQYREAKNYYKKALLIEKNGVFYFLYGNACFMNDDVHEGLENYNLAISAGYDSDEMLFFMGMAYEHLNDKNMALRYFSKACIKNPSRPDYQIKKITAMIQLDMFDSAREAVEELLKNAPELYEGYHLKTQLLLYDGQKEAAEEFARAASERFPEDAALMYDYAKCVAMAGKLDEAYKLVESAKQMKYFEESKHGFILLEAQIMAEKNEAEKAMEYCRECIALETQERFESEARFMLMNLLLTREAYEEAYNVASEIAANNAKDTYYYAALYYRPFCLRRMEKKEEADRLYKEANGIYRLATLQRPEAIDVYLYRAMCLKDMEEYDKALDILEFICGISTEIAEVYTLRAEIYRAMGKKAQVKEELQKAYNLKPELESLYKKEDE